MAISNLDRVGKGLELLKDGLEPFVVREMKAHHGKDWLDVARESLSDSQGKVAGTKVEPRLDVAALLQLMWGQWNAVFRKTLGQAERTFVSELRDVRNRWAHQNPFSGDDAYRALDSADRLLAAVSAPQADEVEKMKMELLRVRFDEQVRSEKRKNTGAAIEGPATGGLRPWREVVTPHRDVASGRYQQAEFAADLWQVHIGEGVDEYKKPLEFFRRTYLTESLRGMLVGGVRRLAGGGGDPVVQLQTNFGGGKTHSMLALYHLFSGTGLSDLPGMDEILQEAGAKALPRVKRVVLVGNKLSPGNPVTKPDGTVVRTLWGELAYQLGGKKAFQRIQADDENATSPGDVLRELFNEHGPCLVLIDEWVAYARQLHDTPDLPGGSFETHFTFAQALTESAKLAKSCLLVVSLPASDTTGSPHTRADDVEVGGERGRAALDRLRNAIGRVEASWRPASTEEGFEIVRRRLFEPLVEREQFVARDTVARAFYEMYRKDEHQVFPPDSKDAEYEQRLKAAYPIHPEVFDRLYSDWSSLVKFQRTRGVLRLMAAVIHSLWEKGERTPLIMPANIAIDDPRVLSELTRYLSDNWVPVIDKDVDGANALPQRLDTEYHGTLGKYQAARRVARTIYMGSAPTAKAAHLGLEDRRINLGCVMPGEPVGTFVDALRRLSAGATYLYKDGNRYWYSTQPTVAKLADDRAEQLRRDSDKVAKEIESRVRKDLKATGDFSRIHPMPQSGQDVPDDMDARLVVLSTDHPFSKEPESPALSAAKAILESRGNAPRLFRNSLVFLAVDLTRLQDLDEAVRRYLAWNSIVAEREALNLDPNQSKQAEVQRTAADQTTSARIPEAYNWLLVPDQGSPQGAVDWKSFRLTGGDSLAARASRRLRNDELLVTRYAASLLRMRLDEIPLWRGNHVEIRTLLEDYAKYLYLPRLVGPEVLRQAISSGLGLLTWAHDSFAYAESYDEAAGRYRGLRCGEQVQVLDGDSGVLVRPEVAVEQVGTERSRTTGAPGTPGLAEAISPSVSESSSRGGGGAVGSLPPGSVRPKRYYATAHLNPSRMGRDAGQIADEIVSHIAGLVGARVRITLEIEAEIPGGASEQVVRTVSENGRALKFTSQAFESE